MHIKPFPSATLYHDSAARESESSTSHTETEAPVAVVYANLGSLHSRAVKHVYAIPYTLYTRLCSSRQNPQACLRGVCADPYPNIRQVVANNPIRRICSSPLKAVKIYRPDDSGADREYEAMRRLQHSSITSTLNSEVATCTYADNPELTTRCLVMTSGLCHLLSVARKSGQDNLGAQVIAGLMSDTLDAVTCLHKLNMTHNDLKTRNIILMPNMHARVIDLEAVTQFDSEGKTQQQSTATAGYIAPELLSVASDSAQFSARVKNDYWALGCIFYELITGQRWEPVQNTATQPLLTPPSPTEKIHGFTSESSGWQAEEVAAAQATLEQLLHLDPDLRDIVELRSFIARFSTPSHSERP